jgi:metallophosphoesterase (TIGR00282 family)
MASNASSSLRVLLCGDVVGRPGRAAIASLCKPLREKERIDLTVINAENAAGGLGLDAGSALEIRDAGADVLTLGDHAWQRRETRDFLKANANWCVRPYNYPPGAPGSGAVIWTSKSGVRVGIMNLIGRVFINGALDCPFRAADEILSGPLKDCAITLCDFHAEATSEKLAMARYLDGRVSVLVGTHSHVQTSDECILPGGTGYITDLGMCGSRDGVIGMDAEVALARFLTGLPHAYKVAEGTGWLSGVVAEIDVKSGKCTSIARVSEKSAP